MDADLEKHTNRRSRQRSNVPLDHFARVGSRLEVDGEDSSATPHQSLSNSVENSTLVEDEFQFDRCLQEQWDKAIGEGIQVRDTGVAFKDLRITGLGANAVYQHTIFSVLNPLNLRHLVRKIMHPPVKDIISGFEGNVKPGEMLLVLGKPGSGCTSLLKVLANQREGFHSVSGEMTYDGIAPQYMHKHYRGDLGYAPEDDVHFPSLTVRQTLTVAAASRTPKVRIEGMTRKEYVNRIVNTLGRVFGLTHAFNTRVGDENIRGISGGEKKRVSIAEMMSMRVRLACWDNSTRGLDASTALEFIRALRIATDIAKVTTIVSIYQASENIYQLFDKVCIINEGRMCYFGPAHQARNYFIKMGYEPANRQTTADFLVSVTDPPSRIIRKGYERRVPRTPIEFAEYFLRSESGEDNAHEVHAQLYDIPREEKMSQYKASARAERSKHMPPSSPYTISIPMQLSILMRRRVQIIRGDLVTQSILLFNFIAQGLIMGSVFLNMPANTSAFYSRGGTIFFAVLFGALSSMAELPALYAQRPIVARHHKAALYYPFIDSLAITIVDIPISFTAIMLFDIILYFMTGLQREVGKVFIFLLFTFSITLTMRAFYRGLAASFPRPSEAQALAGLMTLGLVIYTGFTLPRPSMIGALRWLIYVNPLRYGFESLIANEFHGLQGECANLVPSGAGYENVLLANQVCGTLGGEPASRTVDGDRFILLNYGYRFSEVWRDFGITMVFWVGFLALYYTATYIGGSIAKGGATQLIFKRGAQIPQDVTKYDEENVQLEPCRITEDVDHEATEGAKDKLPHPKGTFSWHHLSYDITVHGGGHKRLLNDVSGCVAPGKLTALMGESGAGKTTLLNALAERLTTGVITGDRFFNGNPLPADFAAQTAYCQQMDIHLETATVRESLRFSAILRQPASVPKEEKYAYVEEVIKMCEMEQYADAIVGHVGEGLNVEQRKRLTIGVELAAKPQLLLFLDEPTSGLSSQSAWAVVQFLRSLADRGQAILCTIHQPSAELFQSFDRMLLLRKGGQTCYFGDIGHNATKLIKYFEVNGGRSCDPGENPAEYMLDVIGAGATARTDIDWHAAWNKSLERQEMERELVEILAKRGEHPEGFNKNERQPKAYAASILVQCQQLLRRSYLDYLRTPSYLMSKFMISVVAGLFIGFSFFKVKNNIQGAQNHMFAVFMGTILAVPHSNMLQVPFLQFRQVYETRERSSKMYHWIPMITTVLITEIPFNIIAQTLYFLCWYWTVGFPNVSYRIGFEYLVLAILFPLYFTTFSQAIAALSPNAEIAGLLFSFLFSFIITFNGVLQPYSQLIKFWHWMYRLSPFTYLIEALVSNGFSHQQIICDSTELVSLTPPSGRSCNDFMQNYINMRGGYLVDGSSTSSCQFCPMNSSDQYLATLNMFYSHRWRNVGFLCAYILFNAGLLYLSYALRVTKANPFRPIMTLVRRSKK